MLTPSTCRAWARPLAALFTLAVVASGCQAAADDGATPSPSPTSTPSGSQLRSYVALGDSYTAAPLFHPEDQIMGCLRSRNNYPAQVAQTNDLTLDDVSCSGANTSHMLVEQHFAHDGKPQPPQFDALGPDTDLVTVGIGANDFRFFGRMIVDCLSLAPTDIDGAPCQEANADEPATDRIQDSLSEITEHVAGVMQGIRERSPDARILMVGYPQLLPESGRCENVLPLARGDYAFVRKLNTDLADAVRQGTEEADAGAEYVDLLTASEGHDICSDHPWIAGVRGPERRVLSLHPYRLEQRAVAGLITDMIAD